MNGHGLRNAIVGLVVGLVIGVVVGASVIAPRLTPPPLAAAVQIVEPIKPEPPKEPPKENAKAPPALRWKVASAYPAALPQLGAMARRLEDGVRRAAGPAFDIRLYDPDTLVPVLDMFDAVSAGAVDAAFATPSYWAKKAPTLQLFSGIPFGPGAGEYLAWFYVGGGRDHFERAYRRHNIHSLPCGLTTAGVSGWFRNEVRSTDEFKGLRMRIAGLGARVLEKMGVGTRLVAGGDIVSALKLGVVDAAEFSMPAVDLELGLSQVARHYYLPGWHQPAALFDLMINLDRWQALSDAQRAVIEAVCGDNVRFGLAESEALQFAALKELQGRGVAVHRWPPEVLAKLETSWKTVAEEMTAADGDFKKAWESLVAFRTSYSIWRELAYP
jgi:TRAP-type mannitol/chloroaromatic compound transport system substrate-binding protein